MDFGGKIKVDMLKYFLEIKLKREGERNIPNNLTNPESCPRFCTFWKYLLIFHFSLLWKKTNYVHINGGGLNQATLPDNLPLSLHHYLLPLNSVPCGKDNYWFYQVFLELSSKSCLFCLLNKPPAVFRTGKSQQTVFSSWFTPTNPDPCETTPKIPSCHATEGQFYA